jgi:glutamine synthetase
MLLASSRKSEGPRKSKMSIRTIGSGGFVERYGLWTEAQKAAAKDALAQVQSNNLRTVRVATADAMGRLRGKTLLPKAFSSAMKNGLDFSAAYFNFDSAEGIAHDPFAEDGGVGFTELSGFRDVVLVADPTTFRILPWSPTTGWVLGDLYFIDGRPTPFDARHKLKAAVADLKKDGLDYVAGLEVEFYVTRVIEHNLAPEHLGSMGSPPTPPNVEAIWRGYAFQSEEHLDRLDGLLNTLADYCGSLGLPLRTMEDEMGPGQLEFTFDVQSAQTAADTMVLFRSMVKQVCARIGLHATFMTLPGLPNFFPSGWHLHQSLAMPDGKNAFASRSGSNELLSEVGFRFVGGLLNHAAEGSVFTTPTVNGYKRRRPNSLAPDRATWGHDNRAAMIRVKGAPGDPTTHVENRIGEPTANPYLYIASQIVSGLDGLHRRLDPGPLETNPYSATHRPLLPTNLIEAVDVLKRGTFFKRAFGNAFVDWFIGIKQFEIERFLSAEPNWHKNPDAVTAWEHREYFSRY